MFSRTTNKGQIRRGDRAKSSHCTHSMQNQRRELEASIERARKELQEGKERWRRLHHERQTLKVRNSASRQPILLTAPAPKPARSPLQAICLAESAIQFDPVGDVNVNILPPPQSRQDSDVSSESQDTSHHQMVQVSRHSRYNQQYAAPNLKQISAFQHHAVVSFSALSKYLTSQKFQPSSQLNHQEMRHAFLMCQTEIAQQLNVPASEICWFVEWPYEACTQQRLCTSLSAWSAGCELSSLVARIAMLLECLFLVMEHEHLSSAADPFFKPPIHPILDAKASPLPPKPQPPDAAVLANASVRCGVNDLVQLDVAMRRILLPLVRQFRSLLPRVKWLAACIQIMRVAQTAIDALRSIPNQNVQASRMQGTDETADQVAQCCSEV
jgi:hypothetical protein